MARCMRRFARDSPELEPPDGTRAPMRGNEGPKPMGLLTDGTDMKIDRRFPHVTAIVQKLLKISAIRVRSSLSDFRFWFSTSSTTNPGRSVGFVVSGIQRKRHIALLNGRNRDSEVESP